MNTSPHAPADLYETVRHEPLAGVAWSEGAARAALERICTSAEREFDASAGGWRLHPQDEPPEAGARSANLYFGAAGVTWALHDLAAAGAVTLQRDYTPWIEAWPGQAHAGTAEEQHGSASYLFGESGALLLAWRTTRRPEIADRLHAVVAGNLHNPAQEPLWGNAGTMLAAVHLAEATAGTPEAARWQALLADAVAALHAAMMADPSTGTWTWQQDLYGSRTHYLGAGHGLAGNAYAALRAAPLGGGALAHEVVARSVQTLAASALHGRWPTPQGDVAVANWHALSDPELIERWLARGRRPFVQDCHGAPGIVCRLAAAAPGDAAFDALLRAAGEMTWLAGPLAKGPSLCHGTAGSAMACLKLWRRFGEAHWLERARRLAMHAAAQVEQARTQHGVGRHSLWTGDLGVACTLWNCVHGNDTFPTLDPAC